MKTAKLSKRALFELLGYVPHAGQAKIHASKAKRRVVACGTRFGKSVVATYEAVAYLMEPRDRMDAWLVAPSYELTKRVFEHVVTVLQEHFPNRILLCSEREHVIRVANLGGGVSELRARSAEKQAGLLGASLDVLIVDEADKLRDACWDEALAARTVDRDARVLLISTPGNTSSWFFKEYRRGGRDADYESFAMPTSTNPHILPTVIEAERGRLDPETFSAHFEAKFIGQDLVPCDVCLGPRVDASCVIGLYEDEQPKTCPACGKLVGDDGLTRVSIANGRWSTTIIHFVNPRLPELNVPGGVTMVLQLEDTPQNPEPLDPVPSWTHLASKIVVIDQLDPDDDPAELPPGCD